MNLTTYKISLDVQKRDTQVFLSAIRGDTNRVIEISLTENGKPFDIAEGSTAVFSAVKPDGNCIYNDCDKVDTDNNLITYRITEQTVAAVGEVKCQIKLIDVNGGVLTAPSFSIIVGDTLYNEQPIIDSSEEFNALTAYLADLQKKLADSEFKGEKGDKGDKGNKGDKGETGEKGEKGEPGKDADVTELATAIVGTAKGTAISVSNSANVGFRNLKIYGRSTQDGTPTPTAPIDVVSVGDDGNISVTVNDDEIVLTTNGLRGVPVTAPSLATYTDASGKMWYADEIDLERGVYAQRTLMLKVLSSWDWKINNDKTEIYANIGNYGDFMKFSGSPMICTHFTKGMWGYTQIGQVCLGNGIQSLLGVSTKSFDTVDRLISWLEECDDVWCVLPLASPIETPLTAEEIAAYKLLKTNYPTTIITNDENAYMCAEYVVDTKTYIDSLLTGASRVSSVKLSASAWEGNSSPYSQVVNVEGVTENSKVDLNPTVEQQSIFKDKDITLVTENDDGEVTVYCIGQKPMNDYTMQVTITEVRANG